MSHVAFTRRGVLSLVLAASFTAGALALPFTVPVNQSQSSLTFDLCVAGRCDTETSPVTGWAIIELDSVDIPTQITLYDFYFHLTNNLNWNLSWGFLGALAASATNVTVLDATPGTAQGPVPITATQYTFTGVPSNATGTLTYHATGVPCYALQASGQLCDDTLDLAPLVRDALVLELPMAPLCRDDCAGLCPQCGANRNEGQCGCVAPRDPRWANLDVLR